VCIFHKWFIFNQYVNIVSTHVWLKKKNQGPVNIFQSKSDLFFKIKVWFENKNQSPVIIF